MAVIQQRDVAIPPWASKLLAVALWAVAFGAIVFCMSQIYFLHARVCVIEETRFTAADALPMWKEIGEIRADIAKTPTPEWLLEDLREIKELIKDLDKKVDQHQDKSH